MHTKACIHVDACFRLLLFVYLCIFIGAEEAGPGLGVLKGQTSIIRRCGATGLSPLVGGRLGWFAEELLWLGGLDRGGLNGNGS